MSGGNAPGGVEAGRRDCARHPAAAPLQGRCPGCLLEAALAPAEPEDAAIGGSFTILVPLGESKAASVFVVREDGGAPGLLRLKRWRTPAPAEFLEQFRQLRRQLEDWRTAAIVRPVHAWVDEMGCPAVITEFRQGMPLIDCVRSGQLHPDRARSALRHVRELLDEAHERGLAHGSVVPGNVLNGRPGEPPFLLDFGLASLLQGPRVPSRWAAADREGLAQIEEQLARLGSDRA